MDNYIVRIYRRKKDNPRLLVGLVEEVGAADKKAFNNLDDLWKILNAAANGRDSGREEWEKTRGRTGETAKRQKNREKNG